MVGAFDVAPAIPLLPLASFLLVLVVGYVAPRFLPRAGALPGIVALAGSLALSLWVVLAVRTGAYANEVLYDWVVGDGTFGLHFGMLLDPLSSLMLVIVSLVSLLVFVHSLGYMNDQDEPGLPRYYAGLSLFAFSMLAFTLADNLLMAFAFFELVGLCSWWLIGHWFREPAPPSAAKKAFLVTRFGDYFFLVGTVAVLVTFGTATFAGEGSFPALAEAVLAGEETVRTFGFTPETWFTVIGLLVLGGVVGKSAQFPLHTWLPDAMEGPTPVSALIHAATMVAAGVYLVARMYGFYALSPTALGVIALVGATTALLAASMGVVKREIKQVLAYSTISQYGYIMLGLGAGGYVAAVFHLTTHAFFKALLFLGAGSIIVAMHHNEDMWDMGGLKDRLPVTYWTFLAGSLALAGIFPFAGFWSKDEVLYETLVHGLNTPVLLVAYLFGLTAVFLTGFYTFRMVLLTFHGEPRSEAARDPHPVRWNITLPLVVLGVLATVGGVLNMVPVQELTGIHLEFLHDWLGHGVGAATGHHYTEVLETVAGYEAAALTPLIPAALSLALALAGVWMAWLLYGTSAPARHTERLGAVHRLLAHNYYQDEFQVWLAEGVTQPVARLADTFDQGVIDGIVNGVSSTSLFAGGRVRRLQSGVVVNYAALLTLGLVILLVAFGLYGGWF
jgi:NADH-quinone oxidoreductase subunit L